MSDIYLTSNNLRRMVDGARRVKRFNLLERNHNVPKRSALICVGLVAVLAAASSAAAAAVRSCPAGVPVAAFNLTVRPATPGPALAMPAVNVVRAGTWIRYEPVGTRFDKNKKARIAVIVVPEDAAESVRVLPARPARSPAEWRLPMRAAAVGLVLGPAGIDESKLSGLLEHDPGVVDRLADYAEQHTKVEALIQALSSYEQSAPGTGSLQGALKGFSSQYGVDLPTLDRTKPADEQASALLRAITPAFANNSSSSSSAQSPRSEAAAFFRTRCSIYHLSFNQAEMPRTHSDRLLPRLRKRPVASTQGGLRVVLILLISGPYCCLENFSLIFVRSLPTSTT